MSITISTQVYREIGNANPTLLQWLDNRQQLFNVTDPDGNEHLFVDNDLPRDSDITPLIMDNTVGFALFTHDGDYIGSYKSLGRAIEAQGAAQLVINTDVMGVEPDEVIASGSEA